MQKYNFKSSKLIIGFFILLSFKLTKMNLFYVENIKATTAGRLGKYYQLSEEDSKHIIRVLRLKLEDQLYLTDGKGFFYRTKIVDDHPKHCKVEIRETIKKHKAREVYIHIAIAPTKNIDRFEWFIEKATEIGIDEITPILCERSERKTIRLDRTEKVLISSMKQSLKAYKPQLNPLTSFEKIVTSNNSATRCIAHCEPIDKIHLKNVEIINKEILVLIGPEGDFTTGEIEFARENGFAEISLSKSRLRTETAGIVACNTINLISE